MKKALILVSFAMLTSTTFYAQSWKDLSNEQKMQKAQDFRADNQKYLKETLGLTQEQLDDVDNVNLCYISSLDRIDRYGKTDAGKENYAKAVAADRSSQLDAIMGADKRKKFQGYVAEKLKKAGF